MNTIETRPKIVVGYDGSAHADDAVDWAGEYARQRGGDVDVVTAWHWPSSYGAPVTLGDYLPSVDARRIAQEGSDRLKLSADRVRVHVVEGPPARMLIDQARDACLLVVGSRGHNNFTEAILGSVSNFCAHHARCPVVIVYPASDRGTVPDPSAATSADTTREEA